RAMAEVPGAQQAALVLTGTSMAEFLDSRAAVQLTLSSAGLAEFTGMTLAAGRYFTPFEERHGAALVVLGHRTAQELAGTHDALWLVGRSIRLGGEKREVVGVLTAPP